MLLCKVNIKLKISQVSIFVRGQGNFLYAGPSDQSAPVLIEHLFFPAVKVSRWSVSAGMDWKNHCNKAIYLLSLNESLPGNSR